MVGWKYEVRHVSGQLSRQERHRLNCLVEKKLASWWTRYHTLDTIGDALGEL